MKIVLLAQKKITALIVEIPIGDAVNLPKYATIVHSDQKKINVWVVAITTGTVAPLQDYATIVPLVQKEIIVSIAVSMFSKVLQFI